MNACACLAHSECNRKSACLSESEKLRSEQERRGQSKRDAEKRTRGKEKAQLCVFGAVGNVCIWCCEFMQ